MIVLIILIILVIGYAIAFGFYLEYEFCWEIFIIFSLCGFLFLLITFYPIIGFTSGLIEDYGQGQRQGYLTKISYKGIVYKTWESQIQVGTGNLAALESPFEFSVTDTSLVRKIKENINKKVIIYYREWLIQPFRYGGTSYNVYDIKIMDK